MSGIVSKGKGLVMLSHVINLIRKVWHAKKASYFYCFRKLQSLSHFPFPSLLWLDILDLFETWMRDRLLPVEIHRCTDSRWCSVSETLTLIFKAFSAPQMTVLDPPAGAKFVLCIGSSLGYGFWAVFQAPVVFPGLWPTASTLLCTFLIRRGNKQMPMHQAEQKPPYFIFIWSLSVLGKQTCL